jgi:hypothetical protein
MTFEELRVALNAAVRPIAEQQVEEWAVAAAGAPLPLVNCHQPPVGITGDKLTLVDIRHDWLNVTFPASDREQVVELVSKFLGTHKMRAGGSNTYSHSLGWESGAILAWSEGRPECWLSMNGDSCDLVPVESKVQFFKSLHALRAKCTRLDAACDLHRSLLGMHQVHAAAKCGHVVGFRRYNCVRPVKNMNTGELEGDMATFGRRGKDGSGRYVRVYDKGLESQGKIDAVRLEVELSGDVAKMWFAQLAIEPDDTAEFVRLLGRIVVGSICIADKSGSHGHADRYKILPWWKRIVELIGTAKIKVERVAPTLEKSVKWLKKSTAVTFARLALAADKLGMEGEQIALDLCRDLIRKGKRLIFDYDRAGARDAEIDIGFLLNVATGQGVIA